MKLHELIYVSTATQDMSPADLTALLNQCREKNVRRNATGLLVYHQGEFMQLLEGNKTDIFSLYETICQDKRNHKNRLMWDGPIEQRSFSNWSMAFLNPNELPLAGKTAYTSFLESGLSQQLLNSPPTMGKTFLLYLRDDFLKK